MQPDPRGPEAWLRPFDQLRVGETFISRARTITETDVVRFAALTGDHHPSHTDAVWAEAEGLGGIEAHGLMSVCYSIGLVPNDYVMALRGVKDLSFERPVRPGDTIRVHGEIARLLPMTEEAGMVSGRWLVLNQRAETVATMDLEALWRRAPL